MMRLLTNSEMGRFRECQRKHHIEYVGRWRPNSMGRAVEIGSVAHDAMERVFLGRRHRLAEDVVAQGVADVILGSSLSDNDKILLEEMMAVYVETWRPLFETHDVMEVEKAFVMPILNVESKGLAFSRSKTFSLAGKIDAIVRNIETGEVLIVEHKTTSHDFTAGSAYWKRLEIDSQLSTYTIGAESLGYPVGASLYDVVSRPDVRDLKKGETPEQRRERVRSKLGEGAHVVRRIERLNGQIRDFMVDTFLVSTQIRDSIQKQEDQVPRNPDACLTRYGSACPYYSHCVLGVPLAEVDGIHQIETPHPELGITEGR